MKEKIKRLTRLLLPRVKRKRRIHSGRLKGKYIVTSYYDYPAAILGYTEAPLIDWFQKNVNSGQTWLDVGAHYGYTAIALSKLVGQEGRVFAFEPMLATAGYLTQTRKHNRLSQLTVLPLALANNDGFELSQLPVIRGMVDSTIEQNTWMETFLVAGLDWLWPQICGQNEYIDGIKIDVQGMELQTLQGMLGTLKTYLPKLVIEFHQGVNRAEILKLLAGVGYSSSAVSVEPAEGETQPQYLDDRSYAFYPTSRDGE